MKRIQHRLALASIAAATMGLTVVGTANAQVSPTKTPFQKQAPAQKPSVESYSMVVQSRGRLGAKVITISADLRNFFGAPSDKGLLVDQVLPDTPAAKSGLRSGDVIVKVGGNPIGEHWDILQATNRYKKDETVELEVIRGKKSRKLNAVLDTDAAPVQLNQGAGKLGFDLGESPFGNIFGKAPFDHGSMGPGNILEKMHSMEERLNELEGNADPAEKAGDKGDKSNSEVPFRSGISSDTSS